VRSHIRIGLASGAAALLPALCAAFAIGICGPLVTFAAGAAAGFFTARQAKPGLPRQEVARLGAMAGGIAGALAAGGQLLGVAGALLYFQATGTPTPLGTQPALGDPAAQTGYYLGGLAVGVCFSAVGFALAAVAGGSVAYLLAPGKEG
jgi:hypothetical protein